MNRLVTVYDNNEPLNNVVSALTLDVDEVFYVYHHEVPRNRFSNIQKVLKKYKNIKTRFIKVVDDEAEIRKMIKDKRAQIAALLNKANAKGVSKEESEALTQKAIDLMNKYQIEEQRFMDSLAMISTLNYANAKRNPLAQTRKWFMSYEQAKTRGTETNPIVGGRLAVSDCSQVTDGAAVVVLASESYIKKRNIKDKPVVKGYGHRVAPMLFDNKIADSQSSPYILPWTRQAVLDAYRRSGLVVKDIDVFETHDCFTSSEYAAISAFGITEPGKEYQAIEDGIISFDGKKPINPSGGLIGCGHPVGASGARMFLDLYKQVTGQAGKYQVPDVHNAMMLNIGGSATTNYVFVVGR